MHDSNNQSMTIRERLERTLAGKPVVRPVYAVYDWFVENRHEVDWQSLMNLGLGRINHANITRYEHPHVGIREERSMQDGLVRRDVYWTTDIGELHEWYLGEWKQEHFIKTTEDYQIMKRAFEGLQVFPESEAFVKSESALADQGLTVGHLRGFCMGRTPLMALQIDWVGLEKFSIDLVSEQPELYELMEVMSDVMIEDMRQAVKTPASQIKLWENLSIETLGPVYYRRHLIPLYEKILAITDKAGKKLQVHYDGKLSAIKDEIASLRFDGIDSFTEPPEGDMTARAARSAWPDKMLWCNLPLGWYAMREDILLENIRRLASDVGMRRFCLMISEDVPANWQNVIPVVLEQLEKADD